MCGSSGDSGSSTEEDEVGGMGIEESFVFMKGKVVALSFESTKTSRMVQKIIELQITARQVELAEEMRGQVVKAIFDKNANFVIQKIVEMLPASRVAFVAIEIKNHACSIARHRYGCRIIQRLLEHSGADCKALFDKIIKDAKELSRTVYGHHVIIHLLEHGSEEQKAIIADILCTHFEVMAQCRHSRDVMLAAMQHCGYQCQQSIALQVFQDANRLLRLAESKNGHLLISAALNSDAPHIWSHGNFCLEQIADSLTPGNKHAKHVLHLLRSPQQECQ